MFVVFTKNLDMVWQKKSNNIPKEKIQSVPWKCNQNRNFLHYDRDGQYLTEQFLRIGNVCMPLLEDCHPTDFVFNRKREEKKDFDVVFWKCPLNLTKPTKFSWKPETWNLKPETWNLKPETWNLKIDREWRPIFRQYQSQNFFSGHKHSL